MDVPAQEQAVEAAQQVLASTVLASLKLLIFQVKTQVFFKIVLKLQRQELVYIFRLVVSLPKYSFWSFLSLS